MPTTPLQFDHTFRPSILDTGGSSGQAAVSYNNFMFPPALTASASVEPVYDDANRVLKYNRITISVECYLFHGLNLGTSVDSAFPNNANNLYSGNYIRDTHMPKTITGPGAGATRASTTDLEMEFVRRRLSEPCQQLVFMCQGLGRIKVGHATGVNPDPDSDGFSRDVDHGPKPQVVEWTPLTNKCCKIKWRCTTCVPPCMEVEESLLPSGITGAVAQFPFTVNFNYNEQGLTTRTIAGKLEVPLSRKAQFSSAHAGSIPATFDFDQERDVITAAFPLLSRFKRTQNYTLSNDRKTVVFILTDTEINSEEAYGEGIADADVTLSVSNRGQFNFNVWDTQLSGSIELMAGYPKQWALAEINRLFHHYYKVRGVLGKMGRLNQPDAVPRELGGTPDTPSSGTSNDTDTLAASKVYLEHISFTDQVYGRRVSFNLRWGTFCTLKTLFEATGIFVPVRTDDTAQQIAWDYWKASLGVILNDGAYANLNFTGTDDVIVSLCQPWTQTLPPDNPEISTPIDPPTTGDEREEGPDTTLPQTEDKDHKYEGEVKLSQDSWIDFVPRFWLEVLEHGSIHSPLLSFQQQPEPVLDPQQARENMKFLPPSINSATGTPDQIAAGLPAHYGAGIDNNAIVHTVHRGQPTYILHFSGTAIRVNYPVPEPHIVSAFGRPVKRYGRTELRPRLLSSPVDVITGKTRNVYGLMWHKSYALPLPPTDAKLKSDGHKEIFGSA